MVKVEHSQLGQHAAQDGRAFASPARLVEHRAHSESLPALVVAVVGLLVWAVSLRDFDLAAMSGFGLLNAAPWTWLVVAVVVPTAYIVWSARGTVSTPVLVLMHITLVAILYATPAILYPEPRYTWVYKHIGMVEYLLENNTLDRTVDVYHNWPGFFILIAGLVKLTGLPLYTVVEWTEFASGILIAAGVYYAIGALTDDRRVRWTAVAVFTVANWIGQGYFSPQALATTLGMLFIAAVLRILGRAQVGPRPPLDRLITRFGVRPYLPMITSAQSSDVAVAMLSFAGMVVTHQLTPVAILLQMVLLIVFLRVKQYWLLVIPVLMEAAWLFGVAWGYISGHLKLLNFNVSENLAVPGSALEPALPGMNISQYSGPMTMGLIGLMAVLGVVSRFRHGWVDVPAIALTAGPVIIVALNSYGAEAVYRVYLYALPWASYFAARFLVSGREERPPWMLVQQAVPIIIRPVSQTSLILRQIIACALLVPSALTANFFLERANYVHPEDVKVARWFEENTESDSFVTMITPSYPVRITAGYGTHIISDGAFAPAVTSWMDKPGKAEFAMEGTEKIFDIFNWRPGYVVFSPCQRNYAQMWGLLPGVEYDRYRAMVERSPKFKVVYRTKDTLVAKRLGQP